MKKSYATESRELKKSYVEVENSIISLFAHIYSETIEEILKQYGEESLSIVKNAFIKSVVELSKVNYHKIKKRSLKSYVSWLTQNLTVGHEYEVIENAEDSVRFKFTGCPWASFFKIVGQSKIGKFFCDTDEPMVKAFNKNIEFDRTKTLMDGDDFCNHHYFISKKR